MLIEPRQIAVLMGPTGSGKSALALEIAAKRPTVIINADAMQMVAGLRIITARPSIAEEAQAEHALYGVLAPAEPTSVAAWLKLVEPIIARAFAENKLPLLVGGTGMYIKALMNGLASIPPIPADIRDKLRALDTETVRQQLEQRDPGIAATLKPGDSQRNLRALEVLETTGISLAEWQRQTHTSLFPTATYHSFAILPERAETYRRIDKRFLIMIENGALEEVRAFNAQNIDPTLPINRAHGVPELMAHLRGEITLEAAIAKGQQNTRNYAKRQMTWLRNQLPEATLVQNAADILN